MRGDSCHMVTSTFTCCCSMLWLPSQLCMEHLSHGCQGKGLGHPRYRIHVWLQCTAGPAQTMAVSATFTVMIAGRSLWGWPCVRPPCFLPSAQRWQDGRHPPAQGVLLLAGCPPTQPPCPDLTPQAAGCSREHRLSQTPPSPQPAPAIPPSSFRS